MITKRKGGYLWGKFIYRMQEGDYELSVEQTESKNQHEIDCCVKLKRKRGITHGGNTFEPDGEKGAVSFERNGRAKEYYPLISQKETVKQETEQFFERVCQGSLRLMVNSFLSSKAVKKEDLDELYRMLDEAREGKE